MAPRPNRHPLAYVAHRLAREPPFRIVARAVLGRLPVSVRTRSLWDLSKRPSYLLGVVTAAEQALEQGVREISAVEFGVAGGEGLLCLQQEAEAVEKETGVGIKVYGFDQGPKGLPEFIGDYRDHPDVWKAGDYPMDEATLARRLTERTSLILGNVKNTVPTLFGRYQPPPIGFVSFDLDLYSSTRDALTIFEQPDKRMLHRTLLYFDDIDFVFCHRFAGELLAIRQFNDRCPNVKIDRWYGVTEGRPFPERGFLGRMFVAHDLDAISKTILTRDAGQLPVAPSA